MSDSDSGVPMTPKDIMDAIMNKTPGDLSTLVVSDGPSQRREYGTNPGGGIRFQDWSKGGWDYVGNRC